MKNFVILALGSNLGNRRRNIASALKKLSKISQVEKCSSIYRSPALVPKGSPRNWNKYFHNCIVAIFTDIPAYELLQKTQEIEKQINIIPRKKGSSGPRMLDIDIITFNNDEINTDDLVIPHPRISERSFVVYPLAEIEPEFKIKNKKISEIKKSLPDIKKLKFNPLIL